MANARHVGTPHFPQFVLGSFLNISIPESPEEMGIPDFLDMVDDETVGMTEEEILPFLEEKGHPAFTMDPLM